MHIRHTAMLASDEGTCAALRQKYIPYFNCGIYFGGQCFHLPDSGFLSAFAMPFIRVYCGQ